MSFLLKEKSVGGATFFPFHRQDSLRLLTYLKHSVFCYNNGQAQISYQPIEYMTKTHVLKI
jgi:hypothetical protein